METNRTDTETLMDAATAEFSRRYPRRSTNTYTAIHEIVAIARRLRAVR